MRPIRSCVKVRPVIRYLLLFAIPAAAQCVAVPIARDLSVWRVECREEPGVIRHLVPPTPAQWQALMTPRDTTASRDTTK